MTTEGLPTLSTRTLGVTAPLTVSTMGLGCMGMSEFYGTTNEAEATATIHGDLGPVRDVP